ncbi:MAG: heme o synthase [Bacillota bacterium]
MKADTLPAAQAAGAWQRAGRVAKDYYRLAKPDIVMLILLTALGGLLAAPGAGISLGLALATLAGVGLTSAGGGVLNCYIDRDIDALMRRTARRAIPAGRVPARHALVYGLALAAAGLAIMLRWVGLFAAALTLTGFLIYVGVYSLWLKRRTPHNIVIGGAAGAMGPLIGWAAADAPLGLAPWVLFGIIFLWTPPHFWSLALLAEEEYRRAGVPMMPNTRGAHSTRRQMLAYTAALAVVAVLPPFLGVGGWGYLGVAGAASAVYVALAARAYLRPSRQVDGQLFRYSMTYLAIVFLALIASARW